MPRRNKITDTPKSTFVRITGQRYDNMLARVTRKGFYGLPFSKDRFREHIFSVMGGAYDGFVRCRYCGGLFALEQVALDHALPLSRGGGVELDNLDLPCMECNAKKGGMTPTEYALLLEFLDNTIPLAKEDVLMRLQMSVALAAAGRWRSRRTGK
jgi:5-methylcytosine-specific restriction endonuclease McrA